MEELKEVYNEIASSWDAYRKKPFPEVEKTAKEWKKNRFKTILDIGCGTGRHLIPLVKLGFNVIGIDFSKEMIKILKNKTKDKKITGFIVADARYLPFKDKKFDCSLAIAVIHHLKTRRKKAVEEIKRVTKKEVLISVWSKNQPRFLFSKKDVFIAWKCNGKTYQRYYHLFTKKEIVSLVKSRLKVVNVFPNKPSKNIFILAKPE